MFRNCLLLSVLALPLSAVDITIVSIQLRGTWSADMQPVIDVNRQAVVMGENCTWIGPVIAVINNRMDATVKARCGNVSTFRKVNLVLSTPYTGAPEGIGKAPVVQNPVLVAKVNPVPRN